MKRRTFLLGLGAGVTGTLAGARALAGETPLRIGLTPVFLDDQAAFLNEWRAYLSRKVGRPVTFVQRSSYREITEQVVAGNVDMAWICGYPFVQERNRMRLLAVPLYRGEPLYRAYVIVPDTDRTTRELEDLQAATFAFSDPNSNSGYLYILHELHRQGQIPERFFRRTFFTWSHRRVVEAVSVGMVQGGAVDGYVWDTLARLHPEITARTRVVQRSGTFGFPPFVAGMSVPDTDFETVQSVLMDMARDNTGARLLEKLNIDGFIPGSARLFDEIADMARATGRL